MTWGALLALFLTLVVACDGDDPMPPEPEPTVNIPKPPIDNRLLKTVESMTMLYDASNKLSRIKIGKIGFVTFDHKGNNLRGIGNENVVIMKVHDDGPIDTQTYRITLDSKGYASKAESVTLGDTWDFKYDAEGRLVYMKRSKNNIEATLIYSGGNIIQVKDSRTANFTYTNGEVTTAYPNYNNLLMFNEMYNIDMGDMAYAYWEGLLGKPTANLPVQYTVGDISVFLNWVFNNDGFVEKMVYKTSLGGKIDYNFTWWN